MFTVLTKITFTQQTPFPDPTDPSGNKKITRNKTLTYDLVHEWKVKSSWSSLTDGGEITLPKNVFYKDNYGGFHSSSAIGINIGGFSALPPMFLRGDKVTIESGYSYYNKAGNEVNTLQTVFTGYVSEVTSKKPFVLKVEDNMFKLKQVQAVGGNNNFFSGSKYTVEKMLAEMISNTGLPFTVNTTTSTLLGDYRANGTIGEVLADLQKKYHFEAYFKGDELRCGSKIYFPSDDGNLTKGGDPTYWKFDFQQNIISDNLEYRRKDDIVLSAVCRNTTEETTGQTTKDGQQKTKKKRLEILITFQNGSDIPTVIVGSKDKPLPPNEGGERHDFPYPGAKTIQDLIDYGVPELKKYYYTGFKGKFTTFGIPFIQFGNYIELVDEVLPERNGRYVVKSVEYSGGVEGNRQEIELEYKIPTTNI